MEIELLRQVVAELAEKITGARIAKIHQPQAELLVLRLWTGQQNLKLLICAAANDCRIHLTERSFANPFTPPRFCQLLRARLSRIESIRQLNDDRIVEIVCQGPKGPHRLLVELTGKGSNLALVDADGKLIDLLKRLGAPAERLRIGQEYRLPGKRDAAAGGLLL